MSLSILGRLDRMAHILPEVRELRITGFQSPAEDEKEAALSLDALVGLGAPHIWPMKVHDDTLLGFGLYPGDLVIVHRGYPLTLDSENPKFKARLAVVDLGDGAGYRMRLIMRNEHDRLVLRAPNRFTPDIDIECDEAVELFGIVTWINGNVG